MEIVSYVTEGALEHRDDMGNVEVIRAGEVQRTTAGTGIMMEEFQDRFRRRAGRELSLDGRCGDE